MIDLQNTIGQRGVSSQVLQEIVRAVDTDKSGNIDYTEFIAASLTPKVYLRDDYLHTAFDMFDVDGSGKIDMVELATILQGYDGSNQCSK